VERLDGDGVFRGRGRGALARDFPFLALHERHSTSTSWRSAGGRPVLGHRHDVVSGQVVDAGEAVPGVLALEVELTAQARVLQQRGHDVSGPPLAGSRRHSPSVEIHVDRPHAVPGQQPGGHLGHPPRPRARGSSLRRQPYMRLPPVLLPAATISCCLAFTRSPLCADSCSAQVAMVFATARLVRVRETDAPTLDSDHLDVRARGARPPGRSRSPVRRYSRSRCQASSTSTDRLQWPPGVPRTRAACPGTPTCWSQRRRGPERWSSHAARPTADTAATAGLRRRPSSRPRSHGPAKSARRPPLGRYSGLHLLT
jgi:hypothetical protein